MKTLTKITANTSAALQSRASPYLLGSCCHAVVAVAQHTHCKQSPVMLVTHRAKELRKAPSLSWRQRQSPGRTSPLQVQGWTLLLLPPCPCYKNAIFIELLAQALSLFVKLPCLGSFLFFWVFLISLFVISFCSCRCNFVFLYLVPPLPYQQQAGGQSPSPKAMLFVLGLHAWNLPCRY